MSRKTTIKPKSPWPGKSPEKWKTCHLCTFYHGKNKWKTCELKFDSGSVEPTIGEIFTGADSEHTGVVTEVETLLSGTWAGGDAAGYLHLDTLSGDDSEQLSIFQDDELINGSTAGNNCLTANGQGNVKTWAVLYPKRLMVKEEGNWYCIWHHKWRFGPKFRDREKLVINEEERGAE